MLLFEVKNLAPAMADESVVLNLALMFSSLSMWQVSAS